MWTKNKYYHECRKRIFNYDPENRCRTVQDGIYSYAIERAVAETKKMKNGYERSEVITYIFFDKRGGCIKAAQELYFSERTVQRWENDFVNLVLKYSGNTE